jgi:hypothetical protein
MAKHAPKGPIKAKNPMDLSDPMGKPKCSATNRQGRQCGKPPIPGGTVCRMHGGAAPQVKAKALERLLALQNPAIDRLTKLIANDEYPSTAYAAAKDVLDRTMGKPKEQLELTGKDGKDLIPAHAMSDAQLKAELLALAGRL